MSSYADTNFFTRIYLELPESEEADRLLNSAKAPLPLTWLHRVEALNAFQLCVFLARLPGQTFISTERAALASANFRGDIQNANFLDEKIIPPPELERLVEELALRHTARHGFRTYDVLHVASALFLGCDVFWTFDAKAAKLAALEGLRLRD